MTMAKALPVIVVAGIFDLVRMFFEMFWFFGPALAAFACTSFGNGVINTDVTTMAGKAVATVCTAGATVAGLFGFELTASLGTVMADAMALVGFLVLGLWVVMTNARIFKVNRSGALWFTGSLGVGVIPFIGTFPVFSVVLFMLYRRQIKVETAALRRWEMEQAEMQQLEREQQVAQLMQVRAAELAASDVY